MSQEVWHHTWTDDSPERPQLTIDRTAMDEMDLRGERESVRRVSKERWYLPSQKVSGAN